MCGTGKRPRSAKNGREPDWTPGRNMMQKRRSYLISTGLYLGTRAFMMLQARMYAIPQTQNMMK